MSDPQREQASAGGEPAGVTRDARIEELLLTGLDHYFCGRHNEAIHVWTRVLFLDRSHARARAYIERARSAIAEGQRESDELLQRGVAAFHDGDADVARRLLTRAAERAGSQQEEALAVLGRIERLDAAGAPELVMREPRARGDHPPAHPPAAPSRSLVWFATLVLIAALGTIGILVATRSGRAPAWLALLPSEARDTAVTAPTLLPVPQPGEVALVRARAFYTRGRLDDALRALDEIARGDQSAVEADALRAEIQRVLLEAAGVPAPLAPGAAAGAPR
jgi:tetratricopeptide (TPR) repeat protein